MIDALEKIDFDIIGSPPFSNAIAKSGEVFAGDASWRISINLTT